VYNVCVCVCVCVHAEYKCDRAYGVFGLKGRVVYTSYDQYRLSRDGGLMTVRKIADAATSSLQRELHDRLSRDVAGRRALGERSRETKAESLIEPWPSGQVWGFIREQSNGEPITPISSWNLNTEFHGLIQCFVHPSRPSCPVYHRRARTLDLRGCPYREEKYEKYVGDTRYITAGYIEVYRQGDRRETGSIHGFRRLPFLALRPQGRQASAAVSTNEMELNVAEIFLDSSTGANQLDP
jgi:hypothetical protein